MNGYDIFPSVKSSDEIPSFYMLTNIVDDARNTIKLPTPKELKDNGTPILDLILNECRLTVYTNGFFSYTNGRRVTVQAVHRCLDPITYGTVTGTISISQEHFLHKPCYIRLCLEGESRIVANQESQEKKKTVRTDNLPMESHYLKDSVEDFLALRIAAENSLEEHKILKQSMKTLTDHQQYIIIKHFAEQKSYDSIAKELGCTKQSVHESAQRALHKLRNCFFKNQK